MKVYYVLKRKIARQIYFLCELLLFCLIFSCNGADDRLVDMNPKYIEASIKSLSRQFNCSIKELGDIEGIQDTLKNLTYIRNADDIVDQTEDRRNFLSRIGLDSLDRESDYNIERFCINRNVIILYDLIYHYDNSGDEQRFQDCSKNFLSEFKKQLDRNEDRITNNDKIKYLMVMLRLKSKIKDINSQKYKMLSKDIGDFDNYLLDLNKYKEIPENVNPEDLLRFSFHVLVKTKDLDYFKKIMENAIIKDPGCLWCVQAVYNVINQPKELYFRDVNSILRNVSKKQISDGAKDQIYKLKKYFPNVNFEKYLDSNTIERLNEFYECQEIKKMQETMAGLLSISEQNEDQDLSSKISKIENLEQTIRGSIRQRLFARTEAEKHQKQRADHLERVLSQKEVLLKEAPLKMVCAVGVGLVVGAAGTWYIKK